MLCPRCRRENRETAEYCTSCAAPLAFHDEPPPRVLGLPLTIDRRTDLGAPGAGPPALPRRSGSREIAVFEAAIDPDPEVQTDLDDTGQPAAASPSGFGLQALAAAPSLERFFLEPEVRSLEPGVIYLRRAASWKRALAWALDLSPFAAAAVWLWGLATRGAGPVDGPAALVDLVWRERATLAPIAGFLVLAAAVYATLGCALGGGTVGKLVVRLRVVARDGRPPSWARAATRSALALLSGALLGMGFLLALFTRSGRGLHDLLAGTYVVEVPGRRTARERD